MISCQMTTWTTCSEEGYNYKCQASNWQPTVFTTTKTKNINNSPRSTRVFTSPILF